MLLPHSSRRFVAAFLGALFPSRCTLCRESLPLDQKGICHNCDHKVEELAIPQCGLCGAERPAFSSKTRCLECQRNKRSFSKGTARFRYTRDMSRLIRRAKYGKRFELWEHLIRKAHPWQALDLGTVDMISSIPMTKPELFRREINASELLAKRLSGALEVPYQKLLRKTRETAPQSSLNRQGRKMNLQGAFRVNKGASVKGKTVLLVDDVFTTGSTLGEAAKTLKEAGAKKVQIAALARSGYYANS